MLPTSALDCFGACAPRNDEGGVRSMGQGHAIFVPLRLGAFA